MTLCIAIQPEQRSIDWLDLVPSADDPQLPGFTIASPADFASVLMDDMPSVAWHNAIIWLHTDASGAQPPLAQMGRLLGRNHGNICVFQSALPQHQVEPYGLRLPCGHTFNLSARAIILTLAEANLQALLQYGAIEASPIHQQLACSPGNASDERITATMRAMYEPMLLWDQSGDIELILVDGVNIVPLEFFSTHTKPDAVKQQVDDFFAAASGKGH